MPLIVFLPAPKLTSPKRMTMVISLSELTSLVELSATLVTLMTLKLVMKFLVSVRMISTAKLMMLASRLTASMLEPLMTELTRALWTMSKASKTAALTVFSTDQPNSNNSMAATIDLMAALHTAASTISAPTLTPATLTPAIPTPATPTPPTPTLLRTITMISVTSTKPATVMMISLTTTAALMENAKLRTTTFKHQAVDTDKNAVSRTTIALKAVPTDNASPRPTISTTKVLFTVAIVVFTDTVDTATAATDTVDTAAAATDTETDITEKISFNPFKEVLKADKLLL